MKPDQTTQSFAPSESNPSVVASYDPLTSLRSPVVNLVVDIFDPSSELSCVPNTTNHVKEHV